MRSASFFGILFFFMTCFVFNSAETQAHNIFKKSLETKLGLKMNCTACHIDKKPKTERNSFGGLFYKEFESEELSKNWKAKKGADKKDYETKVMIPAFEKATEKVLAMTVEDMIKAGMIDGIKSTTSQTDATFAKSTVPAKPNNAMTFPLSPARLSLARSATEIQPARPQSAFDFRHIFLK